MVSTNGAFLLIHAPVLTPRIALQIEQQQQQLDLMLFRALLKGWFAVRQHRCVRTTPGRWSECDGVKQTETDSARVQVHLPALTAFESVDPALLTVPKTSSSVGTVFDGATLSPPPWEGACDHAF